MTIVVKRNTPSPSGLAMTGELQIDGKHFCWTLERGPKVPDHPPIPAGTYKARKSVSPHLNYLCPELLNVPQRVGIRIHVANFWHQLEGCTAIGFVLAHEPNTAESAVYASQHALDQLLPLLPEEFEVQYVDALPTVV